MDEFLTVAQITEILKLNQQTTATGSLPGLSLPITSGAAPVSVAPTSTD